MKLLQHVVLESVVEIFRSQKIPAILFNRQVLRTLSVWQKLKEAKSSFKFPDCVGLAIVANDLSPNSYVSMQDK